MDKLSKAQFELVLNSVLFVFEKNYYQFSSTDDSKKAFKFMAQAECQVLSNNTEFTPDEINPILRSALAVIINK